jgi:phospholipid/cholesterol/gamma-HCH transport system substrate-binding protein
MSEEAKVGVFVLIGMALFAAAIFLLGDYSLQTYYPVYVEFQDVAGLPDKSVVKLSGVAVGKIKRIYLKDDRVRVQLAVQEGVKIYRNSKFLVGSTSLIGSKFLQIDQGDASAGVMKSGEVVQGSATLPIDRAMAKAVEDIQGLVQDLRGDGAMKKNFNEILSNLKETTAELNEIISTSGPHAGKAMERLDDITAKLDGILGKADTLLTRINNGEGVAGALIADQQMKENVTSTLNNLKEASASVKDIVGRVGGFKTYWNIQTKYEPLARTSKSDLGVKIYPREGRYYYLGGANIINAKDQARGVDYEVKNTVDAQLGWEIKGFDLYAGALRGSGGFGVKYRPFYYDP